MYRALKLSAITAAVALTLGAPLAAPGANSRTQAIAAAGKLTITAVGTLNAFGGPTAGTFTLEGSNASFTDAGKLAFTAPEDTAAELKTAEGLTYASMHFAQTLKGRYGNLVVRYVMKRFAVVKIDDYIATGTWSIVRGTGRYAKLKGGGTLVGLIQAAAKASSLSDYDYSFRLAGAVPGA